MACQFQTGELVPLDELGPFIQDALDLIEFANGPVTSPWGARRAAMGHPEPFGMKLLGVGNEQWGFEYFERYEAFAKVLKERHPEIDTFFEVLRFLNFCPFPTFFESLLLLKFCPYPTFFESLHLLTFFFFLFSSFCLHL